MNSSSISTARSSWRPPSCSRTGQRNDRNAPGTEVAFGVRYQQPLNNAIILRINAMYGIIEDAKDMAGISGEIRWKF